MALPTGTAWVMPEARPRAEAHVQPMRFGRLSHYGDTELGTARIRAAAEVLPGDQVRTVSRAEFDFDESMRPWLEFQPLSFTDEASGWESSTTGDLLFGLYRRVQAYGADGTWERRGEPALGIDLFAVSPHGARKRPRWPGVVEGEEGYYGVGTLGFAGEERNLSFNLGGGIGGIPRRDGRSGRLLGGLGITQSLPGLGIDWSTEATRLGIEAFWVWDAPGDRVFGELTVAVSFWVGSLELSLGYRRGLSSESEDDVFFIGFGGLLFDAFLQS
ncbi:MAG: hypothetical protein ACE5F1_03355 [Planctomycetota bacterium]